MGSDAGREVELSISTVAHGGVFVARLEGRVVFVADALPGERVRARITDDAKRSFWRAETVEVLEASPHRQEHIWPEAGVAVDPAARAGGAEFGHIRLEHQRELKAQVLREALERMAGLTLDVPVEPAPAEGVAGVDGTGWRTRVRLHVDADGRVGPFAARSHRVVPVRTLPLAAEALATAVPLGGRIEGVEHVDAVLPADGRPRLVLGRQQPTPVVERVGERSFRVDDTGFWQVHRDAAGLLTRAVQDAVDGDLFDPEAENLDLYGGVGLLAAALADRFGPATRVTSVESSARATGYARENLRDLPGASAETGRVERWTQRLRDADAARRARLGAGTVVIDPPRSGAGRAVVDALAAVAPAQLIYVACDPVALARDTGLLKERGYDLVGLRAFDLFPHTHHLEAVAAFRPTPATRPHSSR